MLVNFNLEGLEEKDVREIKYLLQEINDTLEGGIWHTNIKAGAITGVLSDSLKNTKIGTEALHSNETGYGNVIMGYQAGYNCKEGHDNVAIGYQALYSMVQNFSTTLAYSNVAIGHRALYSMAGRGQKNIAIGDQVLYKCVDGYSNVAIGNEALYNNISGYWNVGVGETSLYYLTSGDENIAIGGQSLIDNVSGNRNVAVGDTSLDRLISGDNNVVIGHWAFSSCETGSGNVALGYLAGRYETGSDKLYIANSNTTTPLIYGEFDNDLIEIYGNLGIGTRVFGTSATRTLAMLNGTIPSTSPANAIQLYAEDVTASSELKVRDEATNVTTLSPHNFELFKPDKNDPYPWSYHSINQLIGKKVNADISGALRELEYLTGKKFLYYEDVNKISLDEYLEDKKQQLIANYIAENRSETEVEKVEAWGEVEVEVQNTKEITGYDTKYEFDEKTGKVKEIKKPKYGKKTVLKNKLKKEFRFNEETGKFLKTIKPTEKEAEKEIKKELTIPDWIEDRIKGE